MVGFVDGIYILFRGKRLGVLGERAVGKTVLQRYMREERLVHDYEQTVRAERVGSARPTIGDGDGTVKVAIRRGRDVPGDSRTNVDAWRDVVIESDYLLYLFDANLLLTDDGSHGKRIRAQCETIAGFLEDREIDTQNPPKVAMIGTHCDLHKDYVSPSRGTRSYPFYHEVRSHSDVDHAALVLGTVLPHEAPVVIGSLVSQEEADDLLKRVFRQEFDLL